MIKLPSKKLTSVFLLALVSQSMSFMDFIATTNVTAIISQSISFMSCIVIYPKISLVAVTITRFFYIYNLKRKQQLEIIKRMELFRYSKYITQEKELLKKAATEAIKSSIYIFF